MSDPDRNEERLAGDGEEEDEEEEAPRNPFDNPLFLPILLLGLSVWFGYDGWINTDEHMQKPTTLWFNRIGFVVLVAIGSWTGYRARQEIRETREAEAQGSAEG
ncbi:MAG: hypothetical protein QNK03_08125 [Myxococcota bacterium]|nr:hypothetical protein [Myxococcota bacterium]